MFNVSSTQLSLRSVAIIGSGLAGLTAALRLREMGVAVTVFEKSRGPGGRMAAKRLPRGSADIGAQYFTIRNPRFGAFLDHYGGADCYGEWPGRFRYQGADGQWQDMNPALRFVGIPRMTAITRALSQHLEVRAGVRIVGLDRGADERWRLTDAQGQEYGDYDAVIVTAPPAQTRELLGNSDLGPLTRDLNLTISRMQACWTVVARFPDGAGVAAEGIMPRSDSLNWAGNNSSKPARDDDGEWWVLHADPDWSDARTEDAPEDIARALVAEFQAVAGTSAEPADLLTHRWLYARPVSRSGPGHLWFHDQQLAVIGDWLDGGRVEGAFNSAESLILRWRSAGVLAPDTGAGS